MENGTTADVAGSRVAVQAGEIMTAPVVTVRPDTSVREIAQTLGRHRISAVPVVDDGGAVVGLVSEYDLIARQGATARDVMTTAVVSVTETTSVDDVRHLLVERRIRRVPVISGGSLVGIISRADVVAFLATEWVCEVCGESIRTETAPEICPKCLSGSGRFALQEQPPGA
ncbi:MAG: CBS domain-containing protein [Actinomycetota bacterium]